MPLGIVTCIPVLTSLLIGQLTIILSLIVLAAWILWKKGQGFQSGLLLALLLIKPHFFLLPFLAMLLQRKIKPILGMFAGMIALFAISYLLIGWSGIISYIHLLQNVTTWDAGYGIDIKAQHSLQTVLLLLTNNANLQEIRIQWYICIALIILPSLYLWTKQFKSNSPQASLQWVVLILATLLTSPHTHFHDLTLVTIVGIITVYVVSKHKITQQKTLLILLALGYIIALAGYVGELYIHPSPRPGWIIITVAYLLFFWGFLFRTIWTIKK